MNLNYYYNMTFIKMVVTFTDFYFI